MVYFRHGDGIGIKYQQIYWHETLDGLGLGLTNPIREGKINNNKTDWSKRRTYEVPYYFIFPIYGYPKITFGQNSFLNIHNFIFGYPKIDFWIFKIRF